MRRRYPSIARRARRRLLFAVLLLLVLSVPAVILLPRKPPPVPLTEQADAVLVAKAERRMVLLLKDGRILREYPVSLGGDPLGHKQREGDGRTPEGHYVIEGRNPNSKFHLSLRISYPSEADRASAAARGVPPGGDIMIHGLPNGLGWLGDAHLRRDWTEGCIAVTNSQIEEIWSAVPDGTPVEIRP